MYRRESFPAFLVCAVLCAQLCIVFPSVGATGPYSPSFYLNSQFMRFVRPGMTRVKAETDEPLLRAIAFTNDVRESFSVVILNGSHQDLQVSLSSTGTIPDSLEMRTTDSTQGFVEGSLQDGRSPVTVPAKGMVSLGYRIRGPQPVDPQPVVEQHFRGAVARQGAARRREVRAFDLRGRALRLGLAGVQSGRSSASVIVGQDAEGGVALRIRGVTVRR